MKKYIFLLLVMLLPAFQLDAQIINKANKDKIGQDIKNGVHNALEAIEQDAHPSGEHDQWSAYVAPKFGLGVFSLPGAGGRPGLGIIGGAAVEVFVTHNIGLSFELTYQHQTANNVKYSEVRNITDAQGNVTGQTVNSGKLDYSLGYIDSYYLIRWYPWAYRPLSFYTGLQLSRLVTAKADPEHGSSTDIKDDLHKGEFDIPIGASYEWKQWQFDVRYYISPRKLAASHRAKNILGNARNMMLSFSVAYRIQLL